MLFKIFKNLFSKSPKEIPSNNEIPRIGNVYVFHREFNGDPWKEYEMKYQVIDIRENIVKTKILYKDVWRGSISKINFEDLNKYYIKISSQCINTSSELWGD
jgi:hypothetical protein